MSGELKNKTNSSPMNNLEVHSNPEVASVFDRYPDPVRPQMLHLRRLILEAANELKDITQVEETLKWGEPSYLAKKGSTIRIDWKEKQPDQYAIYFKCTSQLVPAFKAVYNELFHFEKNRAIVFQLDEQLPEAELKNCIKAGLRYHKVKHLPLLGLK
jgi:hypothetical protein